MQLPRHLCCGAVDAAIDLGRGRAIRRQAHCRDEGQATTERAPILAGRDARIRYRVLRTAGVYRLDMTETVIEKLGTTESTTLTIKREEDGKIRVCSRAKCLRF
jgi:hypothetical protein